MDMDTFERLQTESRLRDALMRLEEAEETDDDEERGAEEDELECPFCGEEFDGVGLCLHIDDEHRAQTKAGGRWRNQRVSSESHSSMYSALKKDAAHIQHRYGGSSRATSLNTVPDPLLSSFVGSFIDDDVDSPKDAQEEFLEKVIEKSDVSEQKAEESAEEPLLPEVKEERTRRSQFMQGLVLSLMFDDIL
ncbi:protein DEHYDRATION-INDUCED 19 homolog 2-like isoform X2 [Hordeum vulgare subsp. vulgare]|uniref:Protein dehydration-induced 19 C-terminal domain-containing protein n=1 Tax=Hordeum vulgare subsp. vulgare TaxID=112509 RepID=A0A8I6Y8B9_HORVV|nr:protein DEHYDRATION-INDUCED 19 homolog 2-like isoform X2 [Hordeum vulgare subsp. vulgare]